MSQGKLIDLETAKVGMDAFINEMIEADIPDGLIYAAGSVRRCMPFVSDLDILVVYATPEELNSIQDFFGSKFGHLKSKDGISRTGSFTFNAEDGEEIQMKIDAVIVERGQKGAGWMHTTGPVAFNIACRQRAIDRGWRLNQYGLFTQTYDRVCDCSQEEPIMLALDYSEWIPPTERR